MSFTGSPFRLKFTGSCFLYERGITVSHEAVRQWCLKFGQDYANQLKRRRPRPGDKWHLDEVFLTIYGERYYLWRAVDRADNVLDILVQSRRNKHAAIVFQKWPFAPMYAMMWPSSSGGCHGAHARAVPSLSE